MTSPYRSAPEEIAPAAPAKLAFEIGPTKTSSPLVYAILVALIVPVAFFAFKDRLSDVALGAMIVGLLGVSASILGRGARGDEIRITVRGGDVTFSRRLDPKSTRTMRLADVRTLTLDTRSIAVVEMGPTTTQYIDTRVGPEIEVSRVVVETERGAHPLFPERIPYSAALERLGSVRAFLRKHGWVPEDERARVDAPEAVDDEEPRSSADGDLAEESAPAGARSDRGA